jgi:glycosyltransferase involved in cell wall biosynthesis
MCLKSNVFVHPSHMDNSPNSVQEAMLIGMPVVATYAGGIPSLLENNKEGLLVQDGDPYALAGALFHLYKDKDFACKLGANARKRGLIRQDKNKILNNLLDVYETIIKNEKHSVLI